MERCHLIVYIDPRNSRFLENELLSIIKFSSLAGTSIDL